MRKEDIFIDLRKLSEEEIKSIPEILKRDYIGVSALRILPKGKYITDLPFLCIGFEFWGFHSSVFVSSRTEITFQQFKELFRDWEWEMLDMLKDIERSLRNGFNITSSKEQEIRKLISEVELKRQGK